MHLLTKELTARALDVATASIWSMIDDGIVRHVHVMIAIRDTTTSSRPYELIADRSFGRRQDWSQSYDDQARGMLRITARTGLPAGEVQDRQPECLEHNDVMESGSVIYGDVMVACACDDPCFNETIAIMVAGLCRGFIRRRQQDRRAEAAGLTYNTQSA